MPKDTGRSEDNALKTLAIIALACLVASFIFNVHMLQYAAVFFLFTGLFLKAAASWIASLWLRASHIIGTINTRIILTVLYYMVLTPIAFLYRRTHGDFLNIDRKSRAMNSHWKRRDHRYEPEDMEKMW